MRARALEVESDYALREAEVRELRSANDDLEVKVRRATASGDLLSGPLLGTEVDSDNILRCKAFETTRSHARPYYRR